MARIIKAENHASKRNEILDVAQRLIYSKGYEQMTIQDIICELQISKGAFYHYFGSKQELLEALIGRMQDEAVEILIPVISDPRTPALEKLERFFATAVSWKTARKNFFLALLHAWYTDENAIVRLKVYSSGIETITPMLSGIFRQGVEEGVFNTGYTEQVGEVILCLLQGFGDALGRMLLAYQPERDDVRIENTVAVYKDALERVLGASNGTIHLVEAESLKEWFSRPTTIGNSAIERSNAFIDIPA